MPICSDRAGPAAAWCIAFFPPAAPAAAGEDETDEEYASVDAEELRGFDISALANYQVGSTGIDNLWDYISYLTKTLGHIDGEGHCHTD